MTQALAAAGALVTDNQPVTLGKHADRPVTRWSTTAGDLVVKVFGTSEAAAAAHGVATALWNSPFGAYRTPPGLAEPRFHLPDCAAVVTDHLVGDWLRDDDPTALRPWLPQVAELLADLHASGCRLPRHRGHLGMLRSMQRKAVDLEGTSLAAAAHRIAGLLARVPATPDVLVPTHGDTAPHNILVTSDGLRLLDWDRAVMAHPARDLSYFGATARAHQALAGRPESWATLELLVAAYGERQDPPEPAVIDLYRACALVRIVHGWSCFRASPDLASPLLAEAERVLRALVGSRP